MLKHRVPTGGDLDRAVFAFVLRREIAEAFVDLGVVAGDGGEDERLVTVGAAQLIRFAGCPVGRHALDVLLLVEIRDETSRVGPGRVVVNGAVGVHEQYEVRLALSEVVAQNLCCLGRVGAGVVEPAALQLVEQAGARSPGRERHDERDDQHSATPVQHQIGELSPHVSVLRSGRTTLSGITGKSRCCGQV